MSRPVRGKCMCICFVFIAIIYCLFEREIWEFSVKMLPWGKALCCMCSEEEDELFFPLCVTAGCCLLLPLNSKLICRNTATQALPPTVSASQSTFSLPRVLTRPWQSLECVCWLSQSQLNGIYPSCRRSFSVWVSWAGQVTQLWSSTHSSKCSQSNFRQSVIENK